MSLRLLGHFRTAVVLGAVMLAPVASAEPAPFSEAQRQAIGEIVKEYLLNNPEILQDVMIELERRQSVAQRLSQQSAIREARQTLLDSPHGNIVGNPSGDVTLVEFFDYNCAYCKRALSDVRTLVKSDAKLRVVLKDFPVLGPDSVEASRVALAVKEQLKGDKLFDYHVKVMETRGRVNGERALSVAKEMGLDMTRLQKDIEAANTRTALQENAGLGDKLGLSGTPAFVIGEDIIPGAVGLEPLRQAVANVRQCGKATC